MMEQREIEVEHHVFSSALNKTERPASRFGRITPRYQLNTWPDWALTVSLDTIKETFLALLGTEPRLFGYLSRHLSSRTTRSLRFNEDRDAVTG
jgi:hypothetical protein